jgi:hypothetical protein
MATKLKCAKCGHELETPKHCNRPMHIEQVSGSEKLVCWMGADCGSADVPQHCGLPMRESA